MKKKFRFISEEFMESFSHMEFVALILIDDRIISLEKVCFHNDLKLYNEKVESVKCKYNNMYQDLLMYREKYKLETMRVGLDFRTSHTVDNLPI